MPSHGMSRLSTNISLRSMLAGGSSSSSTGTISLVPPCSWPPTYATLRASDMSTSSAYPDRYLPMPHTRWAPFALAPTTRSPPDSLQVGSKPLALATSRRVSPTWPYDRWMLALPDMAVRSPTLTGLSVRSQGFVGPTMPSLASSFSTNVLTSPLLLTVGYTILRSRTDSASLHLSCTPFSVSVLPTTSAAMSLSGMVMRSPTVIP